MDERIVCPSRNSATADERISERSASATDDQDRPIDLRSQCRDHCRPGCVWKIVDGGVVAVLDLLHETPGGWILQEIWNEVGKVHCADSEWKGRQTTSTPRWGGGRRQPVSLPFDCPSHPVECRNQFLSIAESCPRMSWLRRNLILVAAGVLGVAVGIAALRVFDDRSAPEIIVRDAAQSRTISVQVIGAVALPEYTILIPTLV